MSTLIDATDAAASGAERDWIIFNTALVYAAAGSRAHALGDGDGGARRGRRSTEPSASAKKTRRRGGTTTTVSDDDDDDEDDDDDDDSTTDDDDDDQDKADDDDDDDDDEYDDGRDADAAFVGPKLLFLHACAAFARDARVRLAAFETWKRHASSAQDEKRALGLIQNALWYRFVVDVAPSEGARRALFTNLVDAACLASERVAVQTRDGACVTSDEYHDDDDDDDTTTTTTKSIALAPSVNGNEDCGVFEVSAAARDACELASALLDAAEGAEGAARRHAKIRVQLEEAYAMAWKSTGKAARLADAVAKRAFMRDIKHPERRLTRARDLLARVVDRRHAPGILAGGSGDARDAQGAKDVFDYISSDVVRAIKSQQQSEGSSDFASAAAALGALASGAAVGAARVFDPQSYVASLDACAEALEREFTRSNVRDHTHVLASLNVARAFARRPP